MNCNCQYTVQQLIVRSDNMEANNESSLQTGGGCYFHRLLDTCDISYYKGVVDVDFSHILVQ